MKIHDYNIFNLSRNIVKNILKELKEEFRCCADYYDYVTGDEFDHDAYRASYEYF